MRQAAKILVKLLSDGELDSSDSGLLADFRTPEVRTELDILGEEMGFSLLDMRGKVYLIPLADSDLLSFSIRDIRESEAKSDRMIDAFLQCYITMIILWMFYGGKNKNPKRVVFLQVKDIAEELDRRFSDTVASQAAKLENEYEINFPQIAQHWSSLQIIEDNRRKTRIGVILKACRFMERQKLLILLDESREIRPTDRLDDLMTGYYLDMRRIEEIHGFFDSMEGSSDAKA